MLQFDRLQSRPTQGGSFSAAAKQIQFPEMASIDTGSFSLLCLYNNADVSVTQLNVCLDAPEQIKVFVMKVLCSAQLCKKEAINISADKRQNQRLGFIST